MKINKEYLQTFNPCDDRWQNYLKHYADWEGSLKEFLELEHLSTDDKLWVFIKEHKGLEKIQREFAFICASRAVEKCNRDEIKEYFTLVLFIFESGELDLLTSEEYRALNIAADCAANRAEYSSADRSAYWAEYRAAYGSANRAANRAADWAAYSSANRAANRALNIAASRAAERKVQLEVAKSLLKEGERDE